MAEITRRPDRAPSALTRVGLPEPYAPLTPAIQLPEIEGWHEYRRKAEKADRQACRNSRPWESRCRACDDTGFVQRLVRGTGTRHQTARPRHGIGASTWDGHSPAEILSTTQAAIQRAIYGRLEVHCPRCFPAEYQADMAGIRVEQASRRIRLPKAFRSSSAAQAAELLFGCHEAERPSDPPSEPHPVAAE